MRSFPFGFGNLIDSHLIDRVGNVKANEQSEKKFFRRQDCI